jgi:hypothetical protein
MSTIESKPNDSKLTKESKKIDMKTQHSLKEVSPYVKSVLEDP